MYNQQFNILGKETNKLNENNDRMRKMPCYIDKFKYESNTNIN
jgi:hypothetical protein